jgi:hypothetical protein
MQGWCLSTQSEPTYTLVSCHYGDTFWVKHMLAEVTRLSQGRVTSAVIVDQSRSSEKELSGLPLVSQVLTFEPDKAQIAVEGHDHPAALDRAIHAIDFQTSHIIVMDTDAFPVRDDWLDRVQDISLALVPGSKKHTHPCLMVFPVRVKKSVNFSEDFLERATRKGAPDTGRRVGAQLLAAGETVTLLEHEPAFNGYRGSFYLDGAFYHHGHGSFVGGDHDQYKGFVSKASEELYRKRILQGRFTLSPVDLGALFIRYVWRRFTNRIRLVLQGPAAKPK